MVNASRQAWKQEFPPGQAAAAPRPESCKAWHRVARLYKDGAASGGGQEAILDRRSPQCLRLAAGRDEGMVDCRRTNGYLRFRNADTAQEKRSRLDFDGDHREVSLGKVAPLAGEGLGTAVTVCRSVAEFSSG